MAKKLHKLREWQGEQSICIHHMSWCGIRRKQEILKTSAGEEGHCPGLLFKNIIIYLYHAYSIHIGINKSNFANRNVYISCCDPLLKLRNLHAENSYTFLSLYWCPQYKFTTNYCFRSLICFWLPKSNKPSSLCKRVVFLVRLLLTTAGVCECFSSILNKVKPLSLNPLGFPMALYPLSFLTQTGPI